VFCCDVLHADTGCGLSSRDWEQIQAVIHELACAREGLQGEHHLSLSPTLQARHVENLYTKSLKEPSRCTLRRRGDCASDPSRVRDVDMPELAVRQDHLPRSNLRVGPDSPIPNVVVSGRVWRRV